MKQWSSCGNEIIEEMSVRMHEKFDKYWFVVQGLMGMATLLDPRFKTKMLLVCFEMLMGDTPSPGGAEAQQIRVARSPIVR
jgi:hypothetical protein